MISAFASRFVCDRRGATAIIIALMIVPMIMCCGAAVDFSRVASARAQLQAAADAGSLAGVGAYQNSTLGTNAFDVATAAFTASQTNVLDYVTINSTSVKTGCTPDGSANSPNECQHPSGAGTTTACGGGGYYCVLVTTTATLKTSLLAAFIPTVALSVRSLATIPFPPNTLTPANFPSKSIGAAGDESGIYAYAVTAKADGTPNYGNPPAANTACDTANDGPIQFEPNLVPANGNVCPYLLIGDSLGSANSTGTLNVAQNQPVAFAFVNYTAHHNQYGLAASHPATTNITYNGKFYTDGTSVNGYPVAGYCPDWNIYGAISQYTDSLGVKVPIGDSIGTYYSAYEVQGYPTTHNANHAIQTFTETNTYSEQTGVDANGAATTQSLKVGTICPNWGGSPANAYSTYYPDTRYSDGNATDIFPPVLSSCTPANPPASPGSWNYSPSNLGYCLGKVQQTANYNNCALLIQPLGTGPLGNGVVNQLPDYYVQEQNTVTHVVTWIPQYDGVTYDGIINNEPPGYYPTATSSYTTMINAPGAPNDGKSVIISTSPNSRTSNGGYLADPPQFTSSQCYDPTSNGLASAGVGVDNNSSKPVDIVANPQLGAIVCNQTPANNYVLFWNDLGSPEKDDLGYWNAIVLFTCSTPPPPTTATGSATLIE